MEKNGRPAEGQGLRRGTGHHHSLWPLLVEGWSFLLLDVAWLADTLLWDSIF